MTTLYTRPFKLSFIVTLQPSALQARSGSHRTPNSNNHRRTQCSEDLVELTLRGRLVRASVVRRSTSPDASIALIPSFLVGTGAFGANNASAGGGLFGQPKPATGFGAFGGGTGTFGGAAGTTSAFGSTGGTGAFGQPAAATTGTGAGIFGQPSTSTGAFGGGGLFGQNKPATGAFGATPSTSSRQVASCFVSQLDSIRVFPNSPR